MTQRPTEIPPGTRAPGYARAPGHRVAFVPSRARLAIRVDGTQIAATADVVTVEEHGYPPRYYLARDGVDMTRLKKTDKTTFCPFKGLATYYAISRSQGEVHAWSYERPYHEAELLRDRIAFDAATVEETVAQAQ